MELALDPQLLAARGYAVLLPDPGLSTGYGQAQIARGWGHWGEEPFTDVMAITDAALKRPELDASRTGLMGGSFGGYMANWVAGSTDRFKAIVTHASLWELRGFTGRPISDPCGNASSATRTSMRRATRPPHRIASSATSARRCWWFTGSETTACRSARRCDSGRTSRATGSRRKFLYFPDENHWVLKPQNARVWYETVLAFLDQHVLGAEWKRPALL